MIKKGVRHKKVEDLVFVASEYEHKKNKSKEIERVCEGEGEGKGSVITQAYVTDLCDPAPWF
jgi:hypothetical protein